METGCGKKQVKSGTEAQMMSLNDLKTFILREAPEPVVAKFIQLQKKDRPSLCALLHMFDRGKKALGQGVTKAASPVNNLVNVANFGFNMFKKSPVKMSTTIRRGENMVFGNRPANLNTLVTVPAKVTNYLKEKDPLASAKVTSFTAQYLKPFMLKGSKKTLKAKVKVTKARKLLNFGGKNMRAPTKSTGGLVLIKGAALSHQDRRKVEALVEKYPGVNIKDIIKKVKNAKQVLMNLGEKTAGVAKMVSSSAISVMKNETKGSNKKQSLLAKMKKLAARTKSNNISKKPIEYSPKSSPNVSPSSNRSNVSPFSPNGSPNSPFSPKSSPKASPKKASPRASLVLEGKAATSYSKDQLVRYSTLMYPAKKSLIEKMSKSEIISLIEKGLKKIKK